MYVTSTKPHECQAGSDHPSTCLPVLGPQLPTSSHPQIDIYWKSSVGERRESAVGRWLPSPVSSSQTHCYLLQQQLMTRQAKAAPKAPPGMAHIAGFMTGLLDLISGVGCGDADCKA